MREARPTHEALVPPTKVRYPITAEQIAQLTPGSTISNVPAEKVANELFEPVFEDATQGDYHYFEARRQSTQGETLDLTVERVNPAEKTILVSLTLPGRPELWYSKSDRQAELKYSFFTNDPLLEKAGRALRNLFKSEPTPSSS